MKTMKHGSVEGDLPPAVQTSQRTCHGESVQGYSQTSPSARVVKLPPLPHTTPACCCPGQLDERAPHFQLLDPSTHPGTIGYMTWEAPCVAHRAGRPGWVAYSETRKRDEARLVSYDGPNHHFICGMSFVILDPEHFYHPRSPNGVVLLGPPPCSGRCRCVHP